MAKYKVNTMSLTKNDKQFFAEIAGLLYKAREVAYKSVNTMMIQTYWQIGRRIVEREQGGKIRANYGEYLIINLSRYLTDILGKGFSEANIRNFRQFYLTFPNGIEFARCRLANPENLSWSHWCAIMRIENDTERAYYITETSIQKMTIIILPRMTRIKRITRIKNKIIIIHSWVFVNIRDIRGKYSEKCHG